MTLAGDEDEITGSRVADGPLDRRFPVHDRQVRRRSGPLPLRADAVGRLLAKAGGKLISYYLTFGDYDFLVIAEAPGETQMAAVLLAAGSSGGVTDLKTTLAMTSVQAKGAFAAASDLAPSFRAPGGV